MGVNLGTLGENITETLADLPETLHNYIFNSCTKGHIVQFPIFIPLYRKEGYAGYGKRGGEGVFTI